jgi:uncharacterized protein (TIGR02996 family)
MGKGAHSSTPGADFEPLLCAVFKKTEDDTARLVFADYLDEHGQPERAELIRLQCIPSTDAPRTKKRRERVAREKELIAGVMSRLPAQLPDGTKIEFRRGFMQLALCGYAWQEEWRFLRSLEPLFREGWVEVARFGDYSRLPTVKQCELFAFASELDFSGSLLDESHVLELVIATAGMHENPRFNGLRLHENNRELFASYASLHNDKEASPDAVEHPREDGMRVTLPTLELFLRSGRLRMSDSVWLGGDVGDAGAELLASADLSGMENLILDRWGMTSVGLAKLANSSALRSLKSFTLLNTRLTSVEMATLGAGTAFVGLTRLDFGGGRFGDAVLVALARATQFRSVEFLGLGLTNVTMAGVEKFLTSPNFPALNSVGLVSTQLNVQEFLPLLLGSPPRLELALSTDSATTFTRRMDGDRLSVTAEAGYRFYDAFLWFHKCPQAKQISSFRIAPSPYAMLVIPEDRLTEQLTRALSPAALRELAFDRIVLGNEASSWLAPFSKYRLDTLRLINCRIQSTGIKRLMAMPLLDSVRVLDLSGNSIGKGGAAAILRSAHLGNLEQLVLTDTEISRADRSALKRKFGAKLVL